MQTSHAKITVEAFRFKNWMRIDDKPYKLEWIGYANFQKREKRKRLSEEIYSSTEQKLQTSPAMEKREA